MRRFRVRFTTRSLMVAILLVSLNLAGAFATSRYYPRQLPSRGGYNNFSLPPSVGTTMTGSPTHTGETSGEDGESPR